MPQQPLGVRHSHVQGPGDAQRRQGDALLRVPLHRSQDREGDGGRRRRPHAAEDQRDVADRRLGRSTRDVARIDAGRPMAQPEVLDAPPAPRRWAALVGAGQPARPLVAGAPASVRTKLLVAFLAIAALLVLVSVVGLQVLGQTNARIEHLGTLQLRSATYQALEAYAIDLRQTLGVRAAGTPAVTPYTGGKTLQGGEQWRLADLQVADVLSQVELGSTSEATFRLRPAARRRARAASDPARLPTIVRALDQIRRLDSSGVTGLQGAPVPARRHRRRQRPRRAHAEPRREHEYRDEGADPGESKRVHVVAESLHRRRRGERRARTRTRRDPLLVAGKPDSADRDAVGGDRGRRLLGSPGRAESRRARGARREREPDERRAPTAVR